MEKVPARSKGEAGADRKQKQKKQPTTRNMKGFCLRQRGWGGGGKNRKKRNVYTCIYIYLVLSIHIYI